MVYYVAPHDADFHIKKPTRTRQLGGIETWISLKVRTF